jgi:GT2 family glycosyltransferase
VQIVKSADRPRTTIIVPTRNCFSLLKACIQSVQPVAARLEAQILVVDNESSDPATLVYFTEIERHGATVLRVGGVCNLARLLNTAATKASSEVLCFLNNAVTATDDQWLDEMLSKIVAPDVGAVGALLTRPSGMVAHGGIVLGPRFAPDDAFVDRFDSDVGYGDLLCVAHECSAVSAACLVTRRQDFVSVGGMDEIRFPLDLLNVDYCLKLRAAGKRIVFTPHAKLIRSESAGVFNNGLPDRKKCFERELSNLRAKWGSVLAADPYYSPILSRDGIPYSALAWPPGPLEPRFNELPVPVQLPPGF